MNKVMLPLWGGCVCGAVRYRLGEAPLLAYACHCHDCQKRSGSAFALTVVIRSADLALTGETDVRNYITAAGRELEHTFCPVCRVRLLVKAVSAPDYASLRAGTLDDASWVRPVAQTWVESAIPWAVIPGVPAVAPSAFDYVELARRWRDIAPDFVRGDWGLVKGRSP
jgi:hypothetical protein